MLQMKNMGGVGAILDKLPAQFAQAADEVWAHVFAFTQPAKKALQRARVSAEYIQSQSQPQKFLLATWTSDRYPGKDSNSTSRGT